MALCVFRPRFLVCVRGDVRGCADDDGCIECLIRYPVKLDDGALPEYNAEDIQLI